MCCDLREYHEKASFLAYVGKRVKAILFALLRMWFLVTYSICYQVI